MAIALARLLVRREEADVPMTPLLTRACDDRPRSSDRPVEPVCPGLQQAGRVRYACFAIAGYPAVP